MKRSFGEDHVQYAKTLSNLSSLLIKLSDYEEAKQGFLKTLEIYYKKFGENHIECANTLGNLSIIYCVLGE
jgi:hypothetical protein